MDGGEQARAVLDQTGEDELEAAVVELGHHIQRLRVATKTRVGNANVGADDAIESDACKQNDDLIVKAMTQSSQKIEHTQISFLRLVRDPNQTKIGDDQGTAFTIVSFGVFHRIDAVDFNLAFPHFEGPAKTPWAKPCFKFQNFPSRITFQKAHTRGKHQSESLYLAKSTLLLTWLFKTH